MLLTCLNNYAYVLQYDVLLYTSASQPFSTMAHFLVTAHQTAHCDYGTYFIYMTYI